MVNIENLYFDFPRSEFSLSVDRLSIEKGEILTIIGPNGAGKTTLLNIIALFEKPKSGIVKVLGYDITRDVFNRLALRRQMSFAFSQSPLLNDTVYNNIALPLTLRGIKDTSGVDEMLALLKISHLRDCNVRLLSQGQKYCVALARALVSRPKLLLLDEPFSSLDEPYKEMLFNALRTILKQRNNSSVIFVTQNHDEALAFSDTIAVMKDGKILQCAKPEDIFTKPASKEVADFIGVETVLEGVITKKEDTLCVIKVGDKFLEAVSEYSEGDNVFVCIRPETVVVALPGAQTETQIDISSARNHFKATITDIEPWRLEYKLTLNCGFHLIASVTKQSAKHLNLKIGDEITTSFKATAIHLIKR